jgi:hypothetical protein
VVRGIVVASSERGGNREKAENRRRGDRKGTGKRESFAAGSVPLSSDSSRCGPARARSIASARDSSYNYTAALPMPRGGDPDGKGTGPRASYSRAAAARVGGGEDRAWAAANGVPSSVGARGDGDVLQSKSGRERRRRKRQRERRLRRFVQERAEEAQLPTIRRGHILSRTCRATDQIILVTQALVQKVCERVGSPQKFRLSLAVCARATQSVVRIRSRKQTLYYIDGPIDSRSQPNKIHGDYVESRTRRFPPAYLELSGRTESVC